VEFRAKRGSASGLLKAYADEIIANAAIPNIVKLLPGEYGEILGKEIQDLKIGASLLTVYFGFKNNLKEIGHNHYSTFVFDCSIRTQGDILSNNRGDFRSFSLYRTDPLL